MKPATYTDEEIIAAGEKLLTDGKRVSPFAIRNAIGGGNPARIKKIWEEHQDTAIEGQIVTEQVELPTEFAETLEAMKTGLDDLARRLYGRAQEIAESRVRETITAAKQAKETAEAEVAEAMEAVTKLDQETDQLQQELTTTKEESRKQAAENARLQERLATLTQENQRQQQALQDKKKLQEQLIALQTKFEVADQQLKEKAAEAKTALEEAATLKGRLAILEEQKGNSAKSPD